MILFSIFLLNLLSYNCDHTFYYLILNDEKETDFYAALLNSTLYTLVTEIYARNIMGQGVLIAYGPEMKPIPVISDKKVSDGEKKKIISSFRKLCSREKIDSVFEELGTSMPLKVSLSKIKPDRRELDKIIMGDILGLTDMEQLEVYRAVVDLVKSRIEKAKSVEKKNKFVEGIDMEMATKDAMKTIITKTK